MSITVKAIVCGSRTDAEGNMKLTFETPPEDRLKASAIAAMVKVLLKLTVEEA
jgi:hypothetical protein